MGLAPGPKAYLVSVGNELLIGRIVNTNMAWLGSRLTELGFRVEGGLIVPDELDAIAWAFTAAVDRGARVIVSTGGLGPTFDDMTAEGLAKAMGVELELNESALRMVSEKYRGELTESRVKMARIPGGSRPIPNPVGTAPGVEAEWRGALIFLLPGVPSEMEAMFTSYVEPRLRGFEGLPFRSEILLRVRGVPESIAAPSVRRVLELGPSVYVKSHPRGAEMGEPLLELHITVYDSDALRAAENADAAASLLERELRALGARVERGKQP